MKCVFLFIFRFLSSFAFFQFPSSFLSLLLSCYVNLPLFTLSANGVEVSMS
jgi:hypothetical protein